MCICMYVCMYMYVYMYVCMYVCVSYGLHLFTSDKDAIAMEKKKTGAPDKRGSSHSEVWLKLTALGKPDERLRSVIFSAF